MSKCVICKKVIEGAGSKLTQKGCETIIKASGGNIVAIPDEKVIGHLFYEIL